MLPHKEVFQAKRNLKSPEDFPPGKHPVTNKYSTRIINQKDPNLTPHLAKGTTGYNPFIDDTNFPSPTEDKHTDTTDNSRTDNKYYVDKMNISKDEDKNSE